MALKAANFSSVQHVGRGMFAWRENEMPMHANPYLVDMPPAIDAAEEALLERLGYDKNGKPVKKL